MTAQNINLLKEVYSAAFKTRISFVRESGNCASAQKLVRKLEKATLIDKLNLCNKKDKNNRNKFAVFFMRQHKILFHIVRLKSISSSSARKYILIKVPIGIKSKSFLYA